MKPDIEYLDYCRVKKIFEKGFGFLTSIYFEENVFFHFSKIKDDSVKSKLEELKRGEVYLFYTSKSVKGRRRTDKIWFDLKEVDKKLIPQFVFRIIEELDGGKINIFELANVVFLLREAGLLKRNQFEKILFRNSVIKIPSSIIAMLSMKEKNKIPELENLIDDVRENKLNHKVLVEKILEII